MSKQPWIDQLDIAIGRIIAEPEVPLQSLPSLDTPVLELLDVARDLTNLPSPEFKERLRGDLEGNTSMTTKTVVLREGFRTLTPYVLPPNESYLDFLKNVFGAVQTERTDMGPGRFHAEMRIGDSMLMLGVGAEQHMPVLLQIWVPNIDEVYNRAIAAGSRSLLAVTEGYGERFGVVEDPGKNQWIISTHLDDRTFSRPPQTLMMFFHPRGAAKFIDFIKRAFNGTEVLRGDSADGRVNYAQIRIGNSVIALNDADERWVPTQSCVYLYVPDVDALYAQARRAGAKSVSEPKDQFYGDRNAVVQDEWGNTWYMATPL
jgi:PhnB protein